MTKLRVLDLFSGIGGFSLGLDWAGGFETVAFCEIESFQRRVLAKNWPGVIQYDDVRTLTADRLRADGIFGIDVITGGFPCQDLSVAGLRAGIEGARSGLWSEIVRLVGELRPRFVIVENVTNLISGPDEKRGGWFSRVLGDLAEVGYDAEWHCLPASAFGAPHSRDRVWFVANPQQEQWVRPIFNADHVSEVIRKNSAERRENGLRSEMGSEVRSIPGRWLDQPEADGVADGVSDWPYRLAGCGNAVLPQISEAFGRAILAARATP